jgi:ADP-heptose:LPS heptosyltransferase
MNKILCQGSNNTIGDFFFTAAPLAHLKSLDPDYIIDVALCPSSKTDYLYQPCKFLNTIVKLEDISDESIVDYATKNGYTAVSLFLKNFLMLKNIQFHALKTWYKTEILPAPNIPPGRYTLVHVTSSANYARPRIPHLSLYLSYITESGIQPLFIGTSQDEELFKQLYPDCVYFTSLSPKLCRFGKDSVFQTISNISMCESALVFSSWSAYAAVLQGVPTLELWTEQQHNLYNPVVRLMLGNPIHLVQNRYDIQPIHVLFSECLPAMKNYAKILYDGF